jgi:hypothetical protein
MRYFYQIFRSSLFLLFLLIHHTNYGQIAPKETHHVILLIDRSGGMEPEKESEVEYVFEELEKICFEKIDESVGRPLLSSSQDYLTVISFGIKDFSDPELKNYISTYTIRRKGFGFYLKKAQKKGGLHKLYNVIKSIGLRKYNGGFFDLEYAFPTTSIPLAINHISNEVKENKFNRTFVIRVSDKEKNSDGVGSELKQYENDLNIENITKIENLFSDGIRKKWMSSLSWDMRRKRSTSHSYKGEKYYIDVIELKPTIKGVSIESILKFKSVMVLKRFPDKYEGNITFKLKRNPVFTPVSVHLEYKLGEKLIKRDTLDFIKSNLDSLTSKVSLDKRNFQIDTLSTLILQVSLLAEYENEFYPGTLINTNQYSSLQTKITGEYERTAKIVGWIPISDWMLRIGKDQAQAKDILDIVFIVLICLAIILILILRVMYLSRKPYAAKIDQFKDFKK